MLIQITNRCMMGCPHCMEDATPDGGLMDFDTTYKSALKFAKNTECAIVMISGGEPTCHPRFIDFCKECSGMGIRFCVCTNGMWLGDVNGEWRFERVAKLPGFMCAQVYSNPKWYRLHDETVSKYKANEGKWKALGVLLDTSEIVDMMDVGRAKECEKAIEETKSSKYHCSCLKTHVAAAQSTSVKQFLDLLFIQCGYCKPMVDWMGDVHASESWLCQSFGNVNSDSPDTIFENISKGRPCGKCIPCQRYLEEDNPTMIAARLLLGQQKQGDEKWLN